MKSISFTKEYTVENKRSDILGEQLTEWFGKSMYWYKKYNRGRVERVFSIMQKEGDHTFKHFMQKIHYD